MTNCRFLVSLFRDVQCRSVILGLLWILALAVNLQAQTGAPLSDSEVDAYNTRMAVQNIGPKYQFTSDNVLLEGAKVMVAAGSNTYKFTMNPTGGGYGISVPPGIANLAQLARNEPSYRATLDLPGIRNYVFWCYTFATPDNWKWNTGFTPAEQLAEYNEIYALAVHLLTQYNNTGKNFYLGHWEGDWSAGVSMSSPNTSNPTPAAIQGMIDWLKVRQKAVDDAKANTPHNNVKLYCYTEVNRVVDAYTNSPAGNQRVINAVVPNVPNLDYVSWSSYDIQGKSTAEIKFYLDYAESFLPTAKAAVIPGKRIFIGEFGYGQYTEAVQAPLNAAFNKTLFEWGCPFALYWTLYDNDLADGATYNLIDSSGSKTANYWLYHYYYNAVKLQLLAFKQSNGRLPTDVEFSTMASSLLATPLTAPVALTVSNASAVVTSQQSATLSSSLLQGIYGDEGARMYLCWGTADGGTVQGNWQNVVDLGLNAQAGTAIFSRSLTGLTPKATHYYRFFASNSGSTSWAAATRSFYTMDVYTFTPTASGNFVWTDSGNWNSYGVPVGGTTTGITIFENTSVALGSGTTTIQSAPAALTLNGLSLNGLGPSSTAAATVSVGTAGNTWTLDGNLPTVSLNGMNHSRPLSITVTPNLSLGQNATFSGNGSAAFAFSGNITGGFSITKSGTSSLAFSGAGSSFSGGLYIREGTVTQSSSTTAFGSGTLYLGDTSGSASATLVPMSGATSFSNAVTVQAGNSGVLTIRGPGGGGSGNLTGNITLNNSVTLDGGNSNSSFLIFKTGSLSGSGNIVVSNTSSNATVVLQHPTSTGYTGLVTANTGTLRLASGSALNAANEVRVNSGATLDVRSNVTIAGLNDSASAGGTVINNGASTTRAVTLGGSGSYAFIGSISDGAGITALTKSGTGFQVLGGANNYSGGTILSGGVLEPDTPTALGSGNVTFGGSAVRLQLGGNVTYANNFTVNAATGTSGQGLIDTASNINAVLGGTVTLNATPTNGGHFGSAGAGSLSVNGAINSSVPVYFRRNRGIFSGGGSYTDFLAGSGTIILGANNGLATAATLTMAQDAAATFNLAGFNQTLAGIVKSTNAATIGSSSTTADSRLTTTGISSFGGVIQDSVIHPITLVIGSRKVALTVNGGSLALTAANTYSGDTEIRAGKLVLGANGSIASPNVTIATGATFDTTAKSSFALPATQTYVIDLNAAGSGSSGRIVAAGLDLTNAVVSFNVTGTLDDAAYVIANYTNKTGVAFASVTPHSGYSVNYAYAGGTQIALVRSAATYDTWATANEISGSPFTGDADGDGLTNGIEYAIGGNPRVVTARPSLVPASNNYTLTYSKGAEAAVDPAIDYVFEISSNLGVWLEVAPTTQSGVAVSYTLSGRGMSNFVRLKIKRLP